MGRMIHRKAVRQRRPRFLGAADDDRPRRRRADCIERNASGYDPWDPFLFTSPQAVADCREGFFSHPDGGVRTLDDLKWDLEVEVMRKRPWTAEELQFRELLNRLLAEGSIEETPHYWHNSPHSRVYRIRETVRIRLSRRTFKLRKGRNLVFQCQMARQHLKLRSPFLTGVFTPTSGSMLCGEMANAMMGRMRESPASVGAAMPEERLTAHGATLYDPAPAPLPMANRLQTREHELRAEEDAAVPAAIPADLKVATDTRVIYFLIDVSVSMAGRRLEAARQALSAFFRAVPVDSRFRVALRSFDESVSELLGSLRGDYTAAARLSLLQATHLLRSGKPSTAIYRAVWRALNDLQRLIENGETPAWYLIVLSDGEDNQGIDCGYGGRTGEDALARRAADLRDAGVLQYLPVAFGSGIAALDRIGGPGFHAEVTDPLRIVGTFADIRQHVMLGLGNAGGGEVAVMQSS